MIADWYDNSGDVPHPQFNLHNVLYALLHPHRSTTASIYVEHYGSRQSHGEGLIVLYCNVDDGYFVSFSQFDDGWRFHRIEAEN